MRFVQHRQDDIGAVGGPLKRHEVADARHDRHFGLRQVAGDVRLHFGDPVGVRALRVGSDEVSRDRKLGETVIGRCRRGDRIIRGGFDLRRAAKLEPCLAVAAGAEGAAAESVEHFRGEIAERLGPRHGGGVGLAGFEILPPPQGHLRQLRRAGS